MSIFCSCVFVLYLLELVSVGLGLGCRCVLGGGGGGKRDVFLLQLCVCPLFAGIGFSGLETGLWEVVGVGVLLKL